ncbi:MAG TPA: DUF1707 domain-containing protein [Streptosporangiaceae bacterium]|jgi:hypothetical protein
MRASTADRDRSVEVLKSGFTDGRLSFAEFDKRLGEVLTARTFDQLMELTRDLPVGPFGRLPAHPQARPMPGPSQMRVAVASVILLCWILLLFASSLHTI